MLRHAFFYFLLMVSEKILDVIIIGAGATGLMAAGKFSEWGLQTLVLEAKEQPG